MKMVTIEAQLPELVGNQYEVAKGKAGSVPLAMKRAMQNLMAKERIRRKHITTIKATITIVNVVATEKTVWIVQRKGSDFDRSPDWTDVEQAGQLSKAVDAWDWIYEHHPPREHDQFRVGKRTVPVETT